MTDTDRELLELAAKAAGIPHTYNAFWCGFYVKNPDGSWALNHHWNPLTDDGDALRLAVKAGIDLTQFDDFARADCMEYVSVDEPYATDPIAATRRAIVRAAAEIGRNMK